MIKANVYIVPVQNGYAGSVLNARYLGSVEANVLELEDTLRKIPLVCGVSSFPTKGGVDVVIHKHVKN
jgi:hypothetical protein